MLILRSMKKKTMSGGYNFRLNGQFTPPGDKSISHRSIILGSISKGKTTIEGFLKSDDTVSTVNAMKALGISINIKADKVQIDGKGLYGLSEPVDVINAGNSGTTARLLTGLLSAQNFFSIITGDRYLRTRPMHRVIKPIRLMDGQISGRDDSKKLPISIIGTDLKGIKYEQPVASAQVKSAILLAGLYANGKTEVIEPQKSRDHTERMLSYLGANIKTEDNFVIIEKVNELKSFKMSVPSDISSAAFFIVAALINKNSEVLIENVGVNKLRTGALEILTQMGGNIEVLNRREICGEPVGDIIVKSSDLKGIEISGDIIPKSIDELPIIAVAACFAEGETTIKNARELRVKETDRIRAIITELNKMGADIKEAQDGMIINGTENLNGSECDSWGDHRIAMSLAIAATKANNDTTINNAECISISYPDFFDTLDKLSN